MKKVVYGGNTAFAVPDLKYVAGLSVWQSGARRMIDLNNGKITPFSRRWCNVCNKQLWQHWQLPMMSQWVSKWYCKRDGISYAGAHHVRV